MIGPRSFLGGMVALALSGGLHAVGFLVVTPQRNTVQLAGGGAAEVAVLGAAFEDFVAGSLPVSTPVTVPVEAPVSSPVEGAGEGSRPVTSPSLPVLPVSAQADVAQAVTAPAVALSGADSPAAGRTAPVVPDVAAAVEAASPAAPTASPRPVARTAPRPPRTTTVQAPTSAPTPPPTPAPTPAPARPAGNAEANASRGSTQGQESATATTAGAAAARDVTGGQGAAAAGYPAQVLRQITRLRRPNAPVRGTVTVSFAIASSGGLADVRVGRSSGVAALDQLALDHIRRAAPFPPPPAGAQTSFRFEFVGRP